MGVILQDAVQQSSPTDEFTVNHLSKVGKVRALSFTQGMLAKLVSLFCIQQ